MNDDCLEWHGYIDPHGYGWKSIRGRRWRVHRLAMAEAFGEDAIEGKVVAHHCDNPACYRVDHLFITDQQGNLDDMVAKGRQARGSTHHKAKLDEEKVREIRTGWGTKAAMARKYGVNERTISLAMSGETWAHV